MMRCFLTLSRFDILGQKWYHTIEAVTTNPMAAKPAFAQGAQIEHSKFGLGSVLACNEEHISIKFDEHGEKKFVLSIVFPNLIKCDRPAPAEKKRAARKKAVPAPA